ELGLAPARPAGEVAALGDGQRRPRPEALGDRRGDLLHLAEQRPRRPRRVAGALAPDHVADVEPVAPVPQPPPDPPPLAPCPGAPAGLARPSAAPLAAAPRTHCSRSAM